MKDAIGNDLQVGDIVVYTEMHYSRLYRGKVFSITPKRIRITPDQAPTSVITKESHSVAKVVS